MCPRGVAPLMDVEKKFYCTKVTFTKCKKGAVNTMNTVKVLRPGRAEMWIRIALALMTVISLFGFVSTVGAAGATQIAGVAHLDEEGDCNDPEGAGADFALILEEDLEGCLYTWVESYDCRPSGTYIERGTETFVGTGPDGEEGSFSTNFVFTGKFDDCENLEGQVFGRCQHPIIAGSGSGDFKGVTGRLDFKDEAETVYRGHLKF